jgi:hypothetical protein
MMLRKVLRSSARGFGPVMVIAAALLLALAFTGCGGDDGDGPVKEPKKWSSATVPGSPGNFTGVAYGKNKFVAVTDAREIFSSADGQTWQKVNPGYAEMSASTQYVYFFGEQFLLVDRGSNTINGNWATSPDGITWTDISGAPAVRAAGGAAYGNGKAFIGSNGGNIYISDFSTLTSKATGLSRTNPGTGAVTTINWINAAAYGKGKYVIGGSNGLIGYSSDLETWTPISWTTGSDLFGTGNNDYVNQIVFSADKGLFLAVGGPSGGQGIAATSPDGITWTQTGGINITTDDNYLHVSYGAGVFLAAFGGDASYTTDAHTWTAIDDTKFGESAINGIAYGDGAGKFVMVGASGKIAYSIPE